MMSSDSQPDKGKNVFVNRKFRKLDIESRMLELHEKGYFNDEDYRQWCKGKHLLSTQSAERMVENVIGTFSLPQGVAVNFPVNNRYYCVPMVVEEPSVVAALSYAGLMSEKSGGFIASADEPLIHGQVQIVGMENVDAAISILEHNTANILNAANRLMPAMVKRGGGAKKLILRKVTSRDGKIPMLLVHVAINTCDAMGANLVNTVCEGIAPMIESLVGGEALLRILSNLADEALANAQVRIPISQLGIKGFSGEKVRDRIVLANELAQVDPWRATTHNKGIMNGIDPVALATGNDWRSIEAAAHAYAARDGQYRALTEWTVDSEGSLCGSITLPMKVGTVGGSLQTNPAGAINLRLLGVSGARELAALMAAVGLAQNFAALRALVTSGIQKGHMAMHARSVALSAGTPDTIFDEVVARLVTDGEIKVWRAKQIAEEILNDS